jgi:hypothetical protein
MKVNGPRRLDTRRAGVVNIPAMTPRPDRIARSLRWAARTAAVIALAAAPGCGGSLAVLTPQEVQAHGVVVVRAAPERVFKASLGALKALGYEIAEESAEKGLIVTKRRSVPGIAEGSAEGAGHDYFRQYTIEIRGGGGGTSRVKATPAIFDSGDDISARKVWDLESPVGERELWKQLFAKIEQML